MPTLPPATTRKWAAYLIEIESTCTAVIDARDPMIPIDLYRKAAKARAMADTIRTELLELAVAPVEVAPVAA